MDVFSLGILTVCNISVCNFRVNGNALSVLGGLISRAVCFNTHFVKRGGK